MHSRINFGSTIGIKGMHYAAKIIALSAYEILQDQDGILKKQKPNSKQVQKEWLTIQVFQLMSNHLCKIVKLFPYQQIEIEIIC